jgi:hypothetical protein
MDPKYVTPEPDIRIPNREKIRVGSHFWRTADQKVTNEKKSLQRYLIL